MNRRGMQQAFDMVYWIVRIVIFIAIIYVFIMLEGIMIGTTIDHTKAETKLMANAMLYSPDSFSYTHNGRTYPGVVDIERFNYETLSRAFHVPPDKSGQQKFFAYNLTLYDENGAEISSVEENPFWHRKWKVLAASGAKGSGSAFNLVEKYPVTIRYPDKSVSGLLVIDITRPAE